MSIKITQANFRQEVVESPTPVVLDFWAPWCGPCRSIAPVLDALEGTYGGRVKVAKVNVDEEQGLAQAFGISGIPTLVAVKGGKIVDHQVGFGGRAALEQLFTKLDGA